MMNNVDQRKYKRFDTFLEGTFELESGKRGLIMLTDFSREGMKASVNRNLKKDENLNMELWFAGSIISDHNLILINQCT